MGLKDIFTKNSWNETHYQNKILLEKEGLMGKLGPKTDFIKFLNQKNLNLSKDELTKELIDEYKAQKVNLNYRHDYLKQCDNKIKELCGGFLYNDSFKQKAMKYKSLDGLTNTFEKSILKHECQKNLLKLESIEDRLDELLQLDCETLDKIKKDVDTSQFKTQNDIEKYMGPEYTREYNEILNKQLLKDEERRKREELALAEKLRKEEEKRKREEKLLKERIKRAQELKKEEDEYYEAKRQQVIHQLKDHAKSVSVTSQSNQFVSEKRINEYNKKREFYKRVYEKEELKQIRRNTQKIKNTKNMSNVDIEIFKKVKSNTALASAALFLATGVLVAEAKEEMKYVRTKLNVKDDGIEIKNPYSYHKFINFRGFKVDKEDNYYLYYIVLSDEDMIHFRTKNEELHEVILDKINSTSGLSYEHV